MNRPLRIVLVTAMALAAQSVGAAPRASSLPVPISPERYRAALDPIQSCGDFFAHAIGLPDATPLLRTLFADSLPQQGAQESGDAFVGRVMERLFAKVGDPSRVVTFIPAEGARFDFGTGLLTVPLTQPLAAVLDRWPGDGKGARTELEGLFGFPANRLPKMVTLPMSPPDSWRFRTGGGRFAILSLLQDFGTDAPVAGTTGQATERLMVRLTPKCALFLNGRQEVPGWRFDGWSAAVQPQ